MPYDLNAMKLLARGGQADIYEIDENRILRVLRGSGPDDARMLMSERAIMEELHCAGARAPALQIFRLPGPRRPYGNQGTCRYTN